MVVDDREAPVALGGEPLLGADLGRGLAQAVPQQGVGVRLARDPQAGVADVVEQDQLADLVRVRGGVGLRASQRALREPRVRASPRLLLAVEEGEADLAVIGGQLTLQGIGDLDHGGRSRRAVVRADVVGDRRLGVVVRRDQDRGLRARQLADHVLQASGDGLDRAVREGGDQMLGEVARGLRARGTRPLLDLHLRELHRPLGVEQLGAGGALVLVAAAGPERDDQRRGSGQRQQRPAGGSVRQRACRRRACASGARAWP